MLGGSVRINVGRAAATRSGRRRADHAAHDGQEERTNMSIRLGDEAPNSTAETTAGTIDFHQWKDGSWAVLFSHPADFTPVCTTELGRTARLKGEFDKRGVRVMGVSVDPIESHNGWAQDI